MDISGYKILRTLGRDGVTTAYLAVQESVGRKVVLKVVDLFLAEDRKFVSRFCRAARVVTRLRHPNIVSVYDMRVDGGRPYMAVECVPGSDLKRRRPALPPSRVLQVARDVARALDYASRNGCLHGGVRPETIILHDQNGRAMLKDFGIARPGGFGGPSPSDHYLSPEQARGKLDSRSDIFSLGMVLYRLLVGRLPEGSDPGSAWKGGGTTAPRLPANLLVLQPIVDRALAVEPAQRFQSGAEFAAAIDGLTADDMEAIQLATKRYHLLRRSGLSRQSEKPESEVRTPPATHQRQRGLHGQRASNESRSGKVSANTAAAGSLARDARNRGNAVSATPSARSLRPRAWLWAPAAGVLVLLLGGIAVHTHWPPPLDRAVRVATEESRQAKDHLLKALGLGDSDSVQALKESRSMAASSLSPDAPAPQTGTAPPDEPAGQSTQVARQTDSAAEEEPEPAAPKERNRSREEPNEQPAPPVVDSATIQVAQPDSGGEEERWNRIDELLTRAQQRMDEGHYLSPRDGSAYDFYTRLAALDESRAGRGLAELEQSVYRAAENHINNNQFEQARRMLLAARETLGAGDRLEALEAEVRRLEAVIRPIKPRIPEALATHEPADDIQQIQQETLEIDRTIHIGFSYRNFRSGSSVVQARLYDESRRAHAALVPVTVSGDEGIRYFEIDGPEEGFAEGRYVVDLFLDDRRLNTVSFTVERGGDGGVPSRELTSRVDNPRPSE